jgi:hypothetical protein
MSMADLDQWTLISDTGSIRGAVPFRPTHDAVVAWNNDTGLRLQRSREEGDFYLALRDDRGRQRWRVRPYPLSREVADIFKRKRNSDVRLSHYASASTGVQILILDGGRSVWAALNVAPSPDILMGLFLRFPPPIRFSWPGMVDRH